MYSCDRSKSLKDKHLMIIFLKEMACSEIGNMVKCDHKNEWCRKFAMNYVDSQQYQIIE